MNNKLIESYDNIPSISGNIKHDNMNGGAINRAHPKFHAYRQQISDDVEKFKEECAKHILLDIYMKVLPFDPGYCDGNRGAMKKDINDFIGYKNTSGLQYLKSAYDSTKAPLLEFVLRSINNIGAEHFESAMEKLKEDADDGLDVPPEPISDQDDDMENQLIDVKKDVEYEDFIEKLKKKTVNKIVADISELLKDKKDESDMSFNIKTESSSFKVAMDYISEWSMKNSQDVGSQDETIGLAIRESTLNQFDDMFRQKGASLNEYTTRLRLGKGIVINESTLTECATNFI